MIVVDNAKAMVLRHAWDATTWHPTYADFASYYGFRPLGLGVLSAVDQGEGGSRG